jgi:cobalt/nickel transport system permease protein
MHMADALLSPTVGGAMWLAAGAAISYSSHRIRKEGDADSEVSDHRIPLMGVLGAFVFAAQMVNFTIPGTGASGHLGGGLLLAILLGPYAGLLTIASVLVIQALFFADGGLLALGANIFNLGVCSCLIAYPLIYRQAVGNRTGRGWITAGAVVAAVVGLQLGSLAVVVETVCSGISELPLRGFLLLMQPIHLAIGLVEGLVTAGVVLFVARVQPEMLAANRQSAPFSTRRLLMVALVATLVTGAVISWFASSHPDGLEWSITRVTGTEEVAGEQGRLYSALAKVQESTSFLPDYTRAESPGSQVAEEQSASPLLVDQWTSLSGVIGGVLTMVLVFGIGMVLRRASET